MTPSVETKSKSGEKYQRTRELLIKHASEEFLEHGYVDASTDRIVENANLTRGSLYYHYSNKLDLFINVVTELKKELAEKLQQIDGQGKNAQEILLEMTDVYYDHCINNAFYKRIVLIDSRTIVGTETWINIYKEFCIDSMINVFDYAERHTDAEFAHKQLLAYSVIGAIDYAMISMVTCDEIENEKAPLINTISLITSFLNEDKK